MPSALPAEVVSRLRELRRTHSIAQVAGLLGVTNKTVMRYSRGIERELCGCGRPGGHRGWCGVMLARSPNRQAFVSAFVPHNKKWTPEASERLRVLWEAGYRKQKIANHLNKFLGRTDIRPHAVLIQAGKIGAKRSGRYLTEMRSAHRKKYWDRKLGRKTRKPYTRTEPHQTDDRNAEIVAGFDAGETLQAVGDRYGISRERVRQIYLRAGLRVGHKHWVSVSAKKPTIIEMWEAGSLLSYIARYVGVNHTTVTSTLAHCASLSRPYIRMDAKTRAAFYDGIMPEVIRLREERWDFGFIGRKFGRSGDTIRDHVFKIRPDLCGAASRAINHDNNTRVRRNFTAYWAADAPDDNSLQAVMAKVLKFLPATMFEEARDEAIQTASVMFLENSDLGKDPKALAAAAVRNYWRDYNSWDTASLDAPVPWKEEGTYMDMLASPEPEMSIEEYLDAKREQEVEFGVRRR